MSALALIAARRGVPVTGSDPDPTAFADLAAAGIVARKTALPEEIRTARAVVVTAAASPDHPDLVLAGEAGVPLVPRKVALAELVNGRPLVALAGTHGKTTTTVMTTEVLRAAGLRPTGLAGGRVDVWGGNALLDGDELHVVEADEYDQAFLTLRPTVAVINNVEPDHLECYGSVKAMEEAYARFADAAEWILVGDADAGSSRVAALLGTRVLRFGTTATAQLRLVPGERTAAGSQAEVTLPTGDRVTLRLGVPGLHNLRNATAALGVAHLLGADLAPVLASLAAFQGVGRRFERHGEHQGIAFVDDYAHHPTEMVVTLAAARQAYPGRRLLVVFQPHLFSRTRDHGTAMGIALAAADAAVVTDVYPAREAPIVGVTGKLVADAVLDAGGIVLYEPRAGQLVDEVASLLRPGDVCLTMGAGDITRLGAAIRERLGDE